MALSAALVFLVQVLAAQLSQIPKTSPAAGLADHLSASPGSAYDSLLTTVPTIAGVVLGLYYGALATLIQSRYGRVPSEIRRLVSDDPAGSTYAGLLSLAMGSSLFLLGVHAAGVAPTRLHAYVLLAVSLVALYGFSALGRRAFDFLDPTRLVIPVLPDLLAAARQATTRGYRYETAEYQGLYQRQASHQLDLLQMLFELAEPEERHGGRRVVELAQYVPPLLRQYFDLKPAIPAASRWYPRIARQRRWYLSDATYLEVAMATRTSLPFEEGIDTDWVEERLLGMVEKQIQRAADGGDWSQLNGLLDVLRGCNRAMGKAWSTPLALDTTDRVQSLILSKLPLTNVRADIAFDVAFCVDLMTLNRLELLLGFGESVRELARVKMPEAVGRIDWRDRKSIYSFPAGFVVSEALESFRSQLRFERDVHGEHVTPSWYLAEELARRLLESLKQSIEPLMTEAARGLPDVPGDPANVERSQVLGAFASRKSEYVTKLANLTDVANELAATLRSLDRSHDLKWPEWDAESIETRMRKVAIDRSLDFASLIAALALVPPGPDRVDYLGEAVSLTAEDCLRVLATGDHAIFKELFPRYFHGCLVVAEQIRRESSRWPLETFATLYTEALIDMMAISGYALVYAEIRRDHRSWILVKELWSRYLSGTDGATRASFLDTAYEHSRNLFQITPRTLIRTGWQMRVDQSLRALPQKRSVRRFGVDQWPNHPSPLIRAIRPGDFGSHFKGQDIFVSCFLRREKPRRDDDQLHRSIAIARRQSFQDDEQ